MLDLHAAAAELAARIPNLNFHLGGVESLTDVDRYDLIVLDNVYEHLPDHEDALDRIDRALHPGGVVYLLMPNRLWPREVHYGLPFLAWLPLPLANVTCAGRAVVTTTPMRATRPPIGHFAMRCDRGSPGRGGSRFLSIQRRHFLAPPFITASGWLVLRRAPALWVISKAFMVVAKKAS